MSNRGKDEKQKEHETMLRKSEDLAKIIRPIRESIWSADFHWSGLERSFRSFEEDYGGLDLDPDFQRGHVWTADQQRHFIENVLRGIVSSAGLVVQFNCPNYVTNKYQGDLPRGLQCVDGLQRITGVREFIAGSIRPFGLHVDDLNGSTFSVRGHYRFRVEIHNFTWKADLLQHYIDLNAGGTAHSAEEIARVSKMLEDAKATGQRQNGGK